MGWLPGWLDGELSKRGVVVTRYGRGRKGRTPLHESRWFFVGWYWRRDSGAFVADGPHGPFPCLSAAMADAAERLGVREAAGKARQGSASS